MVSYIVVILVALAFLAVCRFFFYTPTASRRPAYVPQRRRRDARTAVRNRPGISMRERADTRVFTSSMRPDMDAAAMSTTQVIDPHIPEETKEVPRVTVPDQAASTEMEKTQVVSRDSLRNIVPAAMSQTANPATTAVEEVPAEMAPGPEIAEIPDDAESLLYRHIQHFLMRYATVTPDLAHDAEIVTELAFAKLGDHSDEEIGDMLAHIMVQEALLNAQRIYVMMPDAIVLEMVTDAFADVAFGERDETMTLLAYDALELGTHMDHGHFRILALLLLFHYSRNTNNTSVEAFNRYTKKYVLPLLDDLPTEYSYYQQLEYLQCVNLSRTSMTLGEILHESYPYFFGYEGFTEAELREVLDGKILREEYLVPSVYGDEYYKLAVADSSGLKEFFRNAGVVDETKRAALTNLMQSRPVIYDRKETEAILATLSPDLARLAKAWDSSMLRRSSPTLLGMYIGGAYVKQVIGEDFDLSRWV